MNPKESIDPKYIEIYRVYGAIKFAKAYKYIAEYVTGNEKEIAVKEIEFAHFEIAVYCTGLRHMRIVEYLENIGADQN